MKKIIYTLFAVSILFTACKKEEGCMDAIATNYNADAEKDDGSCTYGIVGGWNCTTMTMDSNLTVSYMGITIDSLSSSGSSTITAVEADFYGLDFSGGPTSGTVYVYEEPTIVTDTSTWEIVGDSLVIDEGDITFKYLVTSNTLQLIFSGSQHQDDGMGMTVDYNYSQTINFTRNNGFTSNTATHRIGKTTWYNKYKFITKK